MSYEVFNPELIVLQAASTEPDDKMIKALMEDVLLMAHADESAIHVGPAEHTFGWKFYTLYVDKALARQISQLPGSGIVDAKGDSLEQKFVGWLNRNARA